MKRTSQVLFGVMLTVAIVMLTATMASAQSPAEQPCHKGRYDGAGKYARCELTVVGKAVGSSHFDMQAPLSRCRVRYINTWEKLKAKAPSVTCSGDRFDPNGDGTVIDKLTGLQWEQKTDDGTVHDRDNLYTWNGSGGLSSAADGTAFTSFLATLNSGSCFAGQCDWRLPTRGELQTILSEPCTTGPCLDEAKFGPTTEASYWSATTLITAPSWAWAVVFGSGGVGEAPKGFSVAVRAVRGSL